MQSISIFLAGVAIVDGAVFDTAAILDRFANRRLVADCAEDVTAGGDEDATGWTPSIVVVPGQVHFVQVEFDYVLTDGERCFIHADASFRVLALRLMFIVR